MSERRANFAKITSLLGALVATSVVLGLLGAGLFVPPVAATGAVARKGVSIFEAQPGEFTQNPLTQQTRILASDGSMIATPYDENRVIVPLSQIAPIMREAQVAIEDSRFYQHGAVDPQGVGRALLSNFRGGSTQGASTLTQQYVKITLQENALRNEDPLAAQAAVASSYTRKFQQLKYAVTLEKTESKNQILQGYLNLVYYGGQAYGVEAAARHFFGVKASQLSLPQAATLAGLVQAPTAYDPITHPAKALARRNVVLDRMHTLKLISDTAWRNARNSKMVLHSLPAQNSCSLSQYPYFCNYIKEWLLEDPALGANRAARSQRIAQGGLTIQTTLDPKIQADAQQEIDAQVPPGSQMNGTDIGAAAAVVEPGTGDVLALAQNTTYSLTNSPGKTSVNYAVDSKYGGSGGFAFGSTAKMFALATALTAGMPINSIIYARPADATSAAVFVRSDYPPGDQCAVPAGQAWAVRNDEGTTSGNISLTDAAAFSVNTAFAGLVAKLGACKVRDMMTNLGLHQGGSGLPISMTSNGKSTGPSAITLGSDSVSPVTLASSYAAIAAGGIYCQPSPVLTITTSDAKLLPPPPGQCHKALAPSVANGVAQILKSVLTKGTAAAIGGLSDKRPVAGKTGTTDSEKQSWFVGFTPQLTTAVWVGTPYTPTSMSDLHLGNKFYGGAIFGATVAAPTWKLIMDRASVGLPPWDFGSPSTRAQTENIVAVPKVAGLSVAQATAALAAAHFRPVTGSALSSGLPAGRAMGTQPTGHAVRSATIVIFTSTGSVPAVPEAPTKTTTPTRHPGL
jgi:membrane peptidoglycan carboxypeptidase